MEAEVKRLAPRALAGARPPKPLRVDTQTLLYPQDSAFAWFAVNYLRTPSRILWDLFETESERLEPLYEELRRAIEAERPKWLDDHATLSVRVPDSTEFPASPLQIRGTIKNAIVDGAAHHGIKVTVDADAPAVHVLVRGTRSMAPDRDRDPDRDREAPAKSARPGALTISVDLAGQSMHARGYRIEESEAPLKENLAAQMLILARWDPRTEVLIDPLAGSGTIPIEAALMATAAPVWVPPRRAAAASLPLFRSLAKSGVSAPLFADARPVIVANEIHTPAIEAMRRNIERAGAGDCVLPLHGDFRDLSVERLRRDLEKKRLSAWPEAVDLARGLVIANPPYGERMTEGRGRGGSDAIAELYAALCDWSRQFGRGWRAAFIVRDDALEEQFGRQPILKKPMWNGPIRVWLLVYDLGALGRHSARVRRKN